MTNKQRLDVIEKFIREHKYADLHTLARHCASSLSTVRRTLNDLETAGIVRRHHGGASLVEDDESIPGGYDFITQDDRAAEEKHAIAEYVAEQVSPGMTVMLDGGTTTYTVARMLISRRIIVITNSLPIAALFNEVGSSDTVVCGGSIYNRLGVLYGPITEKAIEQMHADIVIMGCAGVTPEGVWNSNSMIASYQHKMMLASDKVFWVLDPSKFERRAMALSSAFNDKMTLVSTEAPSPDICEALTGAGASFEIVDCEPAAVEEREP